MFKVERTRGNYSSQNTNLYYDFHRKCYICECSLIDRTDFETEHRIPQSKFVDDSLSEDWNKFLACRDCNGRKRVEYTKRSGDCPCGQGYLGIIDCTQCDPHYFIVLKIDYANEDEIVIETKNVKSLPPCAEYTINLLTDIYSGDCKTPMRNEKVSILISKAISEHTNCFDTLRQLRTKVRHNTDKLAIEQLSEELIKLLSPDSPFSAFKRTYIEEEYKHSNDGSKIKGVLKKILADPRLHTAEAMCCVSS